METEKWPKAADSPPIATNFAVLNFYCVKLYITEFSLSNLFRNVYLELLLCRIFQCMIVQCSAVLVCKICERKWKENSKV